MVVAAGQGRRFGGGPPKQYREVGGAPMLLRALRPFLAHPSVLEVVVALPPEDVGAPPVWLAPLLGERRRAVAGGSRRMDSVEAGIAGLGSAATMIVVHDGARPFPDPGVIDAVIAETRRGHGAVAAVPVADTLKQALPSEVDDAPRIARTVEREGLWRAQTPQGFPRPMLEAAIRAARADGFVGTDEASLVERTGGRVVLVPDVSTNIKVTTQGDLRIAQALAAVWR